MCSSNADEIATWGYVKFTNQTVQTTKVYDKK